MIEASAGIIDAGEPSPAMEDIVDQEEMTRISEEILDDLGEALSARRDEWVAARKASGVEKRWMEDLDQYHGRDQSTKQAASMMESAEQGYPVTNQGNKPQRSTVYVNITRPKTNAVEARLANMLFPSDDRNWGLKPTPKPDLIKAAILESQNQASQDNQSAQPAQPGAQPMVQGAPQAMQQMPMPAAAPVAPTAQEQIAEAERRCKAMQDEIDDQLTECQFNAEGRKLLHDCAVLGTGVLKGPIVVNRVSKSWSKLEGGNGVYVLEEKKEKMPASESVSPWAIFPDPSCGDNHHNGIGLYEHKRVTRKQLRDLIGQPGYLEEQIARVLEEGPSQESFETERDTKMRSDSGAKQVDTDTFDLWEYWGEFTPDDMRACGVDIPDGSTEKVSGCVIFVNKIVIKAFLNPNETGGLPYDFIQWEKVDGSVWGYGVPFLIRPSQRVLNAAWRQLMDNSGMAVGPQIFIKRRGVSPADNRPEITGRKVWYVDDDVNMNDAFKAVDIPNHGQEIQQIIELSTKFADEEASVPMLAQGEKGNAPDTVGGMTILMNSSNVVLGRMVKQYDDCITRPHLRRYYDWNMAYSDKENIKGDFSVDARGSSALLVRDIQSQSLLQLGQFQASPMIAPLVNWQEWFKQVLKLQHLDPTDIMKTESEIAQLSQQPPQPPIQLQVEQLKQQGALQLQQVKAQAEMQMVQLEAQQEQQALANGSATPHMASAQAAVAKEKIRAAAMLEAEHSRANAEQMRAQKELEIATQNGQLRIEELRLKKELALLDYSAKHNLTLEQVKANLAKAAMDNQTKRELAQAEIQLAQSESAADRAHDLHKHHTSLQRDMMSTPDTP